MKKTIKLLIFTLFLLNLFSCSNETFEEQKQTETEKSEKHGPTETTYTFHHNDQTFHIIPLFKEVHNFTRVVHENSSISKEAAYLKNVIDPFQEKALENEADIGTDYFDLFTYHTNLTKLEENSTLLLQKQNQIYDIIIQALKMSTAKLPGKDKTIFIMPLNPDAYFTINNMGGIAAWTLSEDAIIIQLDPSFTEAELAYTIAHEYHHAVYFEEDRSAYNSLIDYVLVEGKADLFAKIIYPDKEVPWIEPLTEGSLERVLEVLKENITSSDTTIYPDLLGGNPRKGLPVWSNYKIGYMIMQSYVKNNPGIPIEEWTSLTGKEILEGSNFKYLLN